jgi:type II secretory pathway pseudopilin PulG
MTTMRNEKGLSLVEVVLALGLMGTVLISVAGMYVLSERQVNSGRSTTEALSVARTIAEEIKGWSFHQTYLMFGYDGSATSYTVDTRSSSYGDHWQATLVDALGDTAYAEVEIQSLGSSGTPILNATRNIRVVVTVFWEEGLRPRDVQVALVRN